jgi:hypothetical protein
MSTSEPLVFLQFGLTVPVAAVNLALRCEGLGIVLSLAPGGKLGVAGPVTSEIRSELMLRKPHLLMLLRYTPSDLHLRDDGQPPPELGPVMVAK